MSNADAMLKHIEQARRQGLLVDLDVHFARLIAGHGVTPSSPMAEVPYGSNAPVVLAAALLSQLTSAGHVCLDLAALAEQPVLGGLVSAPPLAAWSDVLHAHPACGDADAYTPLVLDGARLYMRRYFDYECAVAAAWQTGEAQPLSRPLEAKVQALFPKPAAGEDRLRDQRAAAVAALQKRRILISGGPGTGKTTTLASILALLIAQDISHKSAGRAATDLAGAALQQSFQFEPAPPPLKILLSAPTGKAAARMQDAIRAAKARLPLDPEIRAAMPETAQTLHRLLGARPQGGGMVWRHDADNPLDCDVLVVDEASMIDLALMARLLAALPETARLILLGDRDQLASVDAGAVFADLCSAGASTLGVSFRFDADSGIGRLAGLLRDGDADAAVQLLHRPPDDLRWSPEGSRHAVISHAVHRYADFVAATKAAAADEIFDLFARFRLLTPTRRGPAGVVTLNAEIEKGLAAQGVIPPRSHWYVGKPVMIAANDYALRLFNGDIGICVADPVSGDLRIAFPGEEGLRLLAPARLPAHETAWAMTVHKSQGSEFDEVALVLPDEQGELVTRELVYTAVTRARRTVAIWAGEAVLRAACLRRIVRHSGLVARLQSR
ncbi:MAG TPA: exodeoxyribonuclease V subunit alpha [Roseateles sp.]|nr:exodeoxyribonuclease V subunit alpha [Roseateles sp.]HWT54570.1 exodeoxyribonuclease V subunit alpha [Rhodocyclaceae bacterium]